MPSQVVAGLDSGGFALLPSAVRARECREAVGFGTFADAASPCRPEPARPLLMCNKECADVAW
jgi:hypothetical protein